MPAPKTILPRASRTDRATGSGRIELGGAARMVAMEPADQQRPIDDHHRARLAEARRGVPRDDAALRVDRVRLQHFDETRREAGDAIRIERQHAQMVRGAAS